MNKIAVRIMSEGRSGMNRYAPIYSESLGSVLPRHRDRDPSLERRWENARLWALGVIKQTSDSYVIGRIKCPYANETAP